MNGYYLVEIDPQRGDKPKIVAEPRKGKRSIPFPQQYAFFHQRFNHKEFMVSQFKSHSWSITKRFKLFLFRMLMVFIEKILIVLDIGILLLLDVPEVAMLDFLNINRYQKSYQSM